MITLILSPRPNWRQMLRQYFKYLSRSDFPFQELFAYKYSNQKVDLFFLWDRYFPRNKRSIICIIATFLKISMQQSLFAQNSSLQICAFRCRRVQSPESPLCMELHRPEAGRAGAFSRIPCLRCEIAHLSGSAFLYLARDKIPPAGTAPAGGTIFSAHSAPDKQTEIMQSAPAAMLSAAAQTQAQVPRIPTQ